MKFTIASTFAAISITAASLVSADDITYVDVTTTPEVTTSEVSTVESTSTPYTTTTLDISTYGSENNSNCSSSSHELTSFEGGAVSQKAVAAGFGAVIGAAIIAML